MKFYIIFIVASFLFGCTDIQNKDFIGIWGASDDGGKSFWGFYEYLPDETLIVWGTVPGSSVSYNVEANYVIKKEEVLLHCVTIKKSSIPEFIPVGLNWCDEIVEINSNIFKFRDKAGEITTRYKQQHITRPST